MELKGYTRVPNHIAAMLRSEGVQRLADQASRYVEIDAHQRLEDAKLRAELSHFTRR